MLSFQVFVKRGYSLSIGVWRSQVARTAGGREVVGSSPTTPTRQLPLLIQRFFI